MNSKFSIALSLMLFCVQTSFSQSEFLPSFIVNHENDTVYGQGTMSKSQRYCLFKTSHTEEYLQYYPNEINAFKIVDGKYYVSREVEQPNGSLKWFFLEFLVDGEIDLFSISNRFFIKKADEDLLELNDNLNNDVVVDNRSFKQKDTRYLGYMKLYMSDAPWLFPKIDLMDKLDQRSLVNLSVSYHNAVCDEYDCVNYVKKIPDVIYKFELISGVTKHSINYAPQFGVLVHIWRPLKNENLYLKTGILYSDRPFFLKNRERTGYKTWDYDKEYNIKFPLSFQYVLGKNNFKPTFAIGWPAGFPVLTSVQGGFIYSFSKHLEFSFSSSVDTFITLPMPSQKALFDNRLGHSINFGLIYDFKGNFKGN